MNRRPRLRPGRRLGAVRLEREPRPLLILRSPVPVSEEEAVSFRSAARRIGRRLLVIVGEDLKVEHAS